MKRQDLRQTLYLSTLSPTDRLVFFALENHSNIDGESCPSVAALRLFTALGKSTILRSLDVLEREGYVVRKRTGRSNSYLITVDPSLWITGDRPVERSRCGTSEVPNGARKGPAVGPGRVLKRTGRGAAARSPVDNRGGGALTDARGTFLPGTGWIT